MIKLYEQYIDSKNPSDSINATILILQKHEKFDMFAILEIIMDFCGSFCIFDCHKNGFWVDFQSLVIYKNNARLMVFH